jgi:hypothetical protein
MGGTIFSMEEERGIYRDEVTAIMLLTFAET